MRRVLILAGLLAALTASSAPAAPGEPVPTDRDCLRGLRGIDLQTVSIPQLQSALQAGTISSVDLVAAYLARIDAYKEFNAVRELDPQARATAAALDDERRARGPRGPLHGIPVLLKDNVGTENLPTTAGSIAMEGQIPRRDAFITARLREAGAIVLGKTNLSEWANWMATGMPNGYSSLGGQVVNAYDHGDPSGSSSGSGVASSLALAAAAIGTETSGSILSPSLANSVVGLKTTRGIVSRTGIIPLAEGFDVPGPMVRNVVDAAVMLTAIAGTDPEDPVTAEADQHKTDFTQGLGNLQGVRLAYSPSAGADDPLWQKTLDRLRQLGAVLVESDGFSDEGFAGSLVEIPAIFPQFHYGLDNYLQTEQREGARVHSLAEVIAVGAQHPDRTKYGQDRLIASEAAPGVKEFGDLLAESSRESVHTAIDETLDAANAVAFIAPDGANISIGAAAGHPTVVLPLGYPGGDRMGISFLGRRFADGALLNAAAALETLADRRVPPTQVEGGASPASCDAAAKPPFAAPATPAAEAPADTRTAPATGTPAAPGAPVSATAGGVRLIVRAPSFSARRARRTRRTSLRVQALGGEVRGLQVTVVDRSGRTILKGSAKRLVGRRSLRLRLKARPRPGRARVIVTARTTDGKSLLALAQVHVRR
jgi:amidase